MMDLIGIQKSIDKFNNQTIPALTAAVNELIETADKTIDEDLKQMFNDLNRTLGILMTDVWSIKKELMDDAHGLLDRLNGATATITFKIPERIK